MQTIVNIASLRHVIHNYRKDNLRIALVPTLGNLHEGHVSLIQKAHVLADRVIVSIFVNPLQFTVHEDFHAYPRTLNHDSLKLAETGVHLLFAPEITEIYPQSAKQHTRIFVPQISDELCGAFRTGHFLGVSTIVNKLLNIVQPDVALFGEKDYQQLFIIRKMVHDLCISTEIYSVPTVRDTDGLALSSRNQYLTPQEREIAPMLYRTLTQLRDIILQGERDYQKLCQKGIRILEKLTFKPQYLEIRRSFDLQSPTSDDRSLIILAAAYLGKTRLIDNIIFEL